MHRPHRTVSPSGPDGTKQRDKETTMRILAELITALLHVLEFVGTVVLTVVAFVLLLTVGTYNVLRALPHHETQKWA